MGISVKSLLNHLRERQTELGVNTFNFHHVLRNNKMEPSEYPPQAKATIDGKSPTTEDNDSKTPIPSPAKSPQKKSKSRKGKGKVSQPATPKAESGCDIPNAVASTPLSKEPLTDPPNDIPNLTNVMAFPSTQPLLPIQGNQFPPAVQPGLSATPFIPPYFPFPFPYQHHLNVYLMQQQQQQQSGVGDFKPLPMNEAFQFHNIDPQLLPSGDPHFSFPPILSQPEPQSSMGSTILEALELASTMTPSSKPKRTPKRKRSRSPPDVDITPSRSGRKRKPTQKYLDSLQIDK